jgi:hypothetical protein
VGAVVGPGRRRTGEGEAGWASRKRHASRAEEVCGGGVSVDRSTVERERERQGRACGIFLVKSRFFRRLP